MPLSCPTTICSGATIAIINTAMRKLAPLSALGFPANNAKADAPATTIAVVFSTAE